MAAKRKLTVASAKQILVEPFVEDTPTLVIAGTQAAALVVAATITQEGIHTCFTFVVTIAIVVVVEKVTAKRPSVESDKGAQKTLWSRQSLFAS